MSSIRCHYVPQFYLNYFLEANSKLLWVYDKKDETSRNQPPINTAVIGDYYLSYPDKDGNKDTGVEEFFASLEGMTKPVLDEWRSRPSEWNEYDKPLVAMFLSYMHCRVPRAVEVIKEINIAALEHVMDDMKKITEDPERIEKYYEKFCASKARKDHVVSFEDFKESMANPHKYGELIIGIDEKHAMGESFYMAQTIYQCLMSMHWSIREIKTNNFFVVSDAPLNVFLPLGDGKVMFGAGFGMPNVEISFPLSSKICLCMCKTPDSRYKRVGSSFVNEINKRAVYMAERFIVSSYKSNRIRKMVLESSSHYRKPKIDKEKMKERFKEGWKM